MNRTTGWSSEKRVMLILANIDPNNQGALRSIDVFFELTKPS
jgi:hypothetical protein